MAIIVLPHLPDKLYSGIAGHGLSTRSCSLQGPFLSPILLFSVSADLS